MVMSIKARRKLLITAEAVLAVGICCVLYWALGSSASNKPESGSDKKSANKHQAAQNIEKVQPVNWYTQAMELPLRRPLYDPKPEPVKIPPKVEKPLRLQLMGTIIESGKSSAIIKTTRGDTKFAKIGDVIEDAELIQISSDRALFNFDGRQVELKRSTDGASR